MELQDHSKASPSGHEKSWPIAAIRDLGSASGDVSGKTFGVDHPPCKRGKAGSEKLLHIKLLSNAIVGKDILIVFGFRHIWGIKFDVVSQLGEALTHFHDVYRVCKTGGNA
jgi:hypothetical protein